MTPADKKLTPIDGQISLQGQVPLYRMKLLFVSDQEPRGHGYGLQYSFSISDYGEVGLTRDLPDDPSTIYAILPVANSGYPDDIEKLPYFPSYSKMDKFQRGKYLLWLRDVRQQIDVGYVFVYYYGLERHLVYDDFDAAFDEVRLLRLYHKNGSFQSYSASALVHSCLLRKRLDKLDELYSSPEFEYFGNSNLLIAYYRDGGLTPDSLFSLAFRITGVNRKYARLYPDLYKSKIANVLTMKYGCANFPLASEFEITKIDGIPYPIFANISFPSNVRTPKLPNFLHYAPFTMAMKGIFRSVDEAVKSELQIRSRRLRTERSS